MYYKTHELANLLPNYGSSQTLRKALNNNQDKKGKAKLEGNKEKFIELSNNFLSKIWDTKFKESKNRWCFREDEINKLLEGLK